MSEGRLLRGGVGAHGTAAAVAPQDTEGEPAVKSWAQPWELPGEWGIGGGGGGVGGGAPQEAEAAWAAGRKQCARLRGRYRSDERVSAQKTKLVAADHAGCSTGCPLLFICYVRECLMRSSWQRQA